ncbi:MAG: FMN-binding protein [Bacteroidales bacterium]|nr:FMN-binding protein [Bacteroidales bacterium]
MKTFSNRYIFLYITVLVMVIAVLLTAVSMGLKPRREANQKVEKAQQILRAAGYENVEKEAALRTFDSVAARNDIGGRECYDIRCADGTDGLVVFVEGKGLWGPIWGYVVLADDRATVKGVVFAHKSETPGLGDRITSPEFTRSFVGKRILDKYGNFVSVSVIPKGRGGEIPEENRVDAISGATLTSKGVNAMLSDQLAITTETEKR